MYEQRSLEGREHALPASGRDGKLPEAGGKTQYYHRGLDRNDLQFPCNGIYFREAGAVFL